MGQRYSRGEFIRRSGLLVGAASLGGTAPAAFAGRRAASAAPGGGLVNLRTALKYTSGKRFPGAKVVVVSVSGDQGEWIGKVGKTWADATGAKIELNLIPFGELQDKVLLALSSGVSIGDILNVPAYLDGDLMGGGHVVPVPAEVKRRLRWNDILPLYRQQTEWGGVTYGFPWDGDVHSMYYRKDLIADAKNRSGFKARFHYDLHPPRTWDEWHDVAEFLTQKGRFYGAEELVMRKNQGFHGFISRATAYSKIPGNPAFFFDPETMAAEVANPGFVKALEDLKAMLPFMPPDVQSYGFTENAQAIAGGRVALDIQWGDIGPISIDPKQSSVRGKIGFGLTPGRKQTWDAKRRRWVSFPRINYAPYAAFGGWQNLVPTTSKQQEAAIDFASYLGSPPVLLLSSVTGGSGVNPARLSTVRAVGVFVKAGFPSASYAKEYLDTLLRVQSGKNTVFQMRLPGYTQYQDALELAVSKALSGQASPKAALAEAAKAWNAITGRIGREKQKKAYRQSIGLPA